MADEMVLWVMFIAAGFFIGGLQFGAWLTANKWADNANREYRIEHRGKLYKVKRDMVEGGVDE